MITFKKNILQENNKSKHVELQDYFSKSNLEIRNNVIDMYNNGRQLDCSLCCYDTNGIINNGKNIGYLDYSILEDDKTYHIKMIKVLPEFQRKGIASRLYKELQKLAKIDSATILNGLYTDEGYKWKQNLKESNLDDDDKRPYDSDIKKIIAIINTALNNPKWNHHTHFEYKDNSKEIKEYIKINIEPYDYNLDIKDELIKYCNSLLQDVSKTEYLPKRYVGENQVYYDIKEIGRWSEIKIELEDIFKHNLDKMDSDSYLGSGLILNEDNIKLSQAMVYRGISIDIWNSIKKEGYLYPRKNLINQEKEKPAVWFTTNLSYAVYYSGAKNNNDGIIVAMPLEKILLNYKYKRIDENSYFDSILVFEKIPLYDLAWIKKPILSKKKHYSFDENFGDKLIPENLEINEFENYHLKNGKINWTVFNNESKYYIGNCVDVGNNKNKISKYFTDTNEMISFLNQCIKISINDFLKLCGSGIKETHKNFLIKNQNNLELKCFLYKKYADGMCGFYNPIKDIEYFYI